MMASPAMASRWVITSYCVLAVASIHVFTEANTTPNSTVSQTMNISQNMSDLPHSLNTTETTLGSTVATVLSSEVGTNTTNYTQEAEDKHGDHTGVIVGSAVVGGLGAVLVTACICCLLRSKLKARHKRPGNFTLYNTTRVDRLRNEHNVDKISPRGRPFSPVRPASLNKESNYNINFGFLPSPVNAYTANGY